MKNSFLLLLCFLVVFVNPAPAINVKLNIESLIRDLQNYKKEDSTKLSKMLTIAHEMMFSRPVEAIKFSDNAIILSKKLKMKRPEILAYLKKGYSYHTLRDFDSADTYFQKALQLSRNIKDKFLEVDSYNGICWNFNQDIQTRTETALRSIRLADSIRYELGKMQPYITLFYIFFGQNNISKAQESIYKSLFIAEKYQNNFGLYHNYTNLGILYDYQKLYSKSEEITLKALQHVKNSNDLRTVANTYNNLGELYNHWGKDEQAYFYYTKAIDLMERQTYKGTLSLYYINRSEVLKRLKRFEEALRDLKKAGRSYITMNQTDIDFQNLFNMGDIYFRMGKYKLAIIYLEEAKQICSKQLKTNFNCPMYIVPILETLAKCYEKTNNFKKSNVILWISSVIKDTLFEMNKTKYSLEFGEKYQAEKKEKENQILKQKNEIQNLEIGRRSLISYILGSGFFVIILIASFLFKERKKSEKLLLNILPKKIAKRLKGKEKIIADHFEEASVIFIDIENFTTMSAASSPQNVVKELNKIFTTFDHIASKYGIEKIKTIGDCYMAAAGIPERRTDHADSIAQMAKEIIKTMKDYKTEDGVEIKFRIGMDCGPVVAGVIGEQKFIYDLWGDTVNTASRMESHGVAGKIQVTERLKNKLIFNNEEWKMKFEERGELEIKGKGKMITWFLN